MYKCYLRSTFVHADSTLLRKPTTAQTQTLCTGKAFRSDKQETT